MTPPDLRSIGSATPIPAEGSRYGAPAQATFPGRNGRIAYSVGPIFPQEPPAPSQVFTINPDGSGRRIAFSSNLGGGDLRLYTINRDGSDQRPVFDDQPGYNDLFPGYTPRMAAGWCSSAASPTTASVPSTRWVSTAAACVP